MDWNLRSVGLKDEPGGIIEKDADAVVTQVIAEAILVWIVDPLADPQHGWCCGVLCLILGYHDFIRWLRMNQSVQLVVEVRQVEVRRLITLRISIPNNEPDYEFLNTEKISYLLAGLSYLSLPISFSFKIPGTACSLADNGSGFDGCAVTFPLSPLFTSIRACRLFELFDISTCCVNLGATVRQDVGSLTGRYPDVRNSSTIIWSMLGRRLGSGCRSFSISLLADELTFDGMW